MRPLITTTLATIPPSSFPGAQLVHSSTSGYTAHQEPLEKQVYEIMGSTMTATLKKPFSQLRSRETIPRERDLMLLSAHHMAGSVLRGQPYEGT